eukprot:1085240-Ditylum_brightwellii.AAC.1
MKGADDKNDGNIAEKLMHTPCCNIHHDDHYNYTKAIDNPKDWAESTVWYGISCWFCNKEFQDSKKTIDNIIYVPGRRDEPCNTYKNFKE